MICEAEWKLNEMVCSLLKLHISDLRGFVNRQHHFCLTAAGQKDEDITQKRKRRTMKTKR